jgi:hypothetical protein
MAIMQVQKVCQGANTVPNCGVVRGSQVVVGTSGLKEFLGKLGRFFEKNLHEQTSGYF